MRTIMGSIWSATQPKTAETSFGALPKHQNVETKLTVKNATADIIQTT